MGMMTHPDCLENSLGPDYIMSEVVIYDYGASGLIGIDISTSGDMAMASYK